MREMADGDLHLLLDARQEGPLVVDLEGEDAVLIRQLEGRAEGRAVGGVGDWC